MNEDGKNTVNDVIDETIKNFPNPYYSKNNLIIHKEIVDMTVKAKGNIISYADCENCTIESEEGSVFLLFGSLRNTNIQAAKNIYIKHSMHSNLTAGIDVVIEKSAFMSNIKAGNKVISESDESKIIGGIIHAKNAVISNEFGNKKNVHTEINIESRNGEVRFKLMNPGVKVIIDRNIYFPKTELLNGTVKIYNNKITVLQGTLGDGANLSHVKPLR